MSIRYIECLKPQGLLAIQALLKPDDDIDKRLMESYNSSLSVSSGGPKVTFVEEQDINVLLARCNFSDVEVKLVPVTTYYDSFADFSAWYSATLYTDINELPDRQMLEDFKMSVTLPDSRVKSTIRLILVKARKDVTMNEISVPEVEQITDNSRVYEQ